MKKNPIYKEDVKEFLAYCNACNEVPCKHVNGRKSKMSKKELDHWIAWAIKEMAEYKKFIVELKSKRDKKKK